MKIALIQQKKKILSIGPENRRPPQYDGACRTCKCRASKNTIEGLYHCTEARHTTKVAIAHNNKNSP